MERIIKLEPETRFDIVGHSMGGMVATYLVATARPESVKRYIQSVVTLDSPLLGFDKKNPFSGCAKGSEAWQDILGDTQVVREITSIEDKDILDRLFAINSSHIGDKIPDTRSLLVDCSGGGTVSLATRHSCVWADETALVALANFINRRL